MSHPDPLFDPDNAYEDDDMMIEDENYDDHNDFHDENNQKNNFLQNILNNLRDDDMVIEHDPSDMLFVEYLYDGNEDDNDSYDDSMDGDAESAFGSCGWGVDEYYGHYESGDDY